MAESTVPKYITGVPITLQTTPLAAMETSFQNASNMSVFSGASNGNNGMAWYGFKATSNLIAKAIVFRATSAGVSYVAIATRDTSGNWTAMALQ